MAENSGIEWTHHTFNPWIGCTKISPACDFCYAEAQNNHRKWNREGWGAHAARKKTKQPWRDVRKFQRDAAAKAVRYRVFTASLSDVFDNHRSIEQAWRDELWALIKDCPDLDFLMLTKRPENIEKMLPPDWHEIPFPYPNVWLGATVENQKAAERARHLIRVPASVHFLSMEPLLGPVDLSDIINGLQWVITGGESGSNYRPANPDWFRSLRDQCAAAEVPFLFKQWEGKNQRVIKALGRELDGVVHDGYPTPPATIT